MNFLENSLGKSNSFWKYIVVFLVSFVAMNIIGAIPFAIAVAIHVIRNKESFSPETAGNLSNLGLSQNLVLALTLFSFIVGLITACLLVGNLHKQTFKETVNGTKNIRWNHIFTGFAFWFLLQLVYLGINYVANPDNFTLQFNVETFIPLFFIALLFIPFQTTFEEFLFRGYLAQGIAAWTRNRWLAICIPGILFGLMHVINPEIKAFGFWNVMPQYIIFGLLFGLISVLDDGIELSLGMHAANNIFACLFVTFEASALKTPAILFQKEIHPVFETGILLIAGVIIFFFFARKYKWNLTILNKKVEGMERHIESEAKQSRVNE
jgi:membrane protease YdiL (CAAX protease family)